MENNRPPIMTEKEGVVCDTLRYTWMEWATVEGEDKPRLLTPHANEMEYEYAFDFDFETPEEAVKVLIEWGHLEEAKIEGWMLCVRTLAPLGIQPTLPKSEEG